MSPRFVVGGRSDVGMQRRNNQDSLYAGPHLIAVADGVGGAAGGEVASRLTIGALVPLDAQATTTTDPGGALRAAADRADTGIRDGVARDRGLTGMATTLSAIIATEDALTLGHIGDSRAYLLRAGALTQLTHDHTLVQSLIDEGQITPEEALTHPRRSWILRALDGRGAPDLDVTTLDTQPGDRYLVCSDGLSSYVDEAAIALGLGDGSPQEAADRLVDLALRAGGSDNISCAVGDLADDQNSYKAAVQEPILAGAIAEAQTAVASADTTVVDPATAAGTPPAPQTVVPAAPVDAGDDDEDDAPSAGRKRSIGKRLAAVAVLVILLIVAAGVGVAIDIHHRYYVAPSAGKVAIFRGVKGNAVGHKLSSVQLVTNIPVSALPQSTRDNISGGFDASSRTKADGIVANLRSQACASATATPAPSPSPTASQSPSTRVTTTPTPAWCTGGS